MTRSTNKFWPLLQELGCEGLSRDDPDDYSKPNNPPLPVPLAEIAEIEKKLGVALPQEYRQFLLEVGGLLFHGTNVRPIEIREGWGDLEIVNTFIGSSKEGLGLLWTIEATEDRLPKELIPIGEDPFGKLHCLAVRGNHLGKIYFCYHDEEPSWENISLVAESFADFIS